MIFKRLAIFILITPVLATGGEVSDKNNAFRTYLIQLAYITAISVCEDPSRKYYKELLQELLGTGKKYSDLTDANKLVLIKKHKKFELECQTDALKSNEYKNHNLVKIYCYELFLNRYDSVENFVSEIKFFDKNGDASSYIKDLMKTIELDTEYDLKTAECFKEINKLHRELISN